MGVQGLLPVLQSVTDQVHVSKYAGKTVGVDASGWLYKGAYSCPVDLVLGRPTDAYLNFSIQQIKQLQAYKITPILVFDGAPLPAKAQENAARGRARAEWKLKAQKLLQESEEAQDGRAIFVACTRAVSVTNAMVRRLVQVLRRMDITFYVAPYEADAQLAFLSRHKIVDVVISDDSDCVPYGVKTVLFKLSLNGWGSELKRTSLGANEDLSFVGWTEEMFIQLCVLAGCDYCPSVRGIGIMTAFKIVNQYKTPNEVLQALQQKKEALVPKDFAEHFYAAFLTYRHQLIFDPRDAKLKMLSPLDISKDILHRVDKSLGFLGNVELRDDVVASIASGQIHPVTYESYAWKDTAAAVLREEQIVANHKRSKTRSSTSSESSGIVLPRRHQKDAAVATSANTPDNPSQEEDPITTRCFHGQRMAASRVRYEKPRPSSRSSWTHLDSVLGSSDHIMNFRSPKVSENFKPLAALHEPSASIRSTSITAHSLKEFESCPVRDHIKRVRNPTNRRRDGKGSGFEGEVLCRVDQDRTSSHENSAEVRRSTVAAICDSDRMTDEENAPLQQAKRPKTCGRPSSSSSPQSSHMSEASSQKLLVRPTPFDCGQKPPAFCANSIGYNWKLPQHHSQQPRSPPSAATKPVCNYAYVMTRKGRFGYEKLVIAQHQAPRTFSRFADLAGGFDDEEKEEASTITTPGGQASTAVFAAASAKDGHTEITETEKAKLHLVRANPSKLKAIPLLVTFKQRERLTLTEAVRSIDICRGDSLPMETSDSTHAIDFPSIEAIMGIRPVITPSSGNCMAMALAQAVADHDLSAQDDSLEAFTEASSGASSGQVH